jgi:hypothetical protein
MSSNPEFLNFVGTFRYISNSRRVSLEPTKHKLQSRRAPPTHTNVEEVIRWENEGGR